MEHLTQTKMTKSFLLITLACLQACAGGSSSDNTTATSGDNRVLWSSSQLSLLGGVVSLITGNIFTLNATIVPPTGEYADDIYVRGNNAYVSYNVPGATANGAIDQMNMTFPTNPVRTATYLAPGFDVNGVYVDASSNVYAIGGDGVNGSVLKTLTVGSNSFSAATSTTYLPSFAGTGVRLLGSTLYALTGNTGGMNLLTPGALTSTATPTLSITDARGMDQAGASNLWVIAGGGNLYEVSTAGAILNTVPFSGANNIAESKSAVHVGTTVVAASLGSQGAALVCMSDHRVMAQVPQGSLTGFTAAQTVTNSVTFGNGLMFVANGLAGVSVYTITNPLLQTITNQILGNSTACGTIALTYQGYIDLGSASGYSANNVYYSNGVLYVATGAGGFKVITVNLTLFTVLTSLVTSI